MNLLAIFRSLSCWFRFWVFASVFISLYLLKFILKKPNYEGIYSGVIEYISNQIPFAGAFLKSSYRFFESVHLNEATSFLFRSVFNFALVIFFLALTYLVVTLGEDIRKRIVRWYHKINGTGGVSKKRHGKIIEDLKDESEPSHYCITYPQESNGKENTPPYLWNPSGTQDLSKFTETYGDDLRIGIVLAGGGAKGAYQAGSMMAIYKFLERLDALKYVRMVSGTSIGTWNAMFWLTHNIANGVHRSWWHTIKPKRIVQPTYYIPYYNNYILSNKSWQGYFSGLFTTEEFNKHLSEIDPETNAENPHFYFTRTNVGSAALEYSTNYTRITNCKDAYPVNNIDDVKKSVFMSMDIPPMFKRMQKGNEWFEDGGVVDNLPIKFATKHENCHLLFILPLNASFEKKVDNRSIFKRLMRVMDIRQGALERDSMKDMMLYNELLAKGSKIAKHKNKTTAFIVCPRPPLEIGTTEFWKTKEAGKAFDLAYCATKEELQKFDFSPDFNETWMTLYDKDGKVSYKKYE